MRNREQERQPGNKERQRTFSLPGSLEDEKHQVEVEKAKSGELSLRVTKDKHLIFSVAVSTDEDLLLAFADGRQVIFPATQHPSVTEQLPPMEATRQPEASPITLEGYPVRQAHFDKDKRVFSLTIAHHPDPKDRKQVAYYELIAEGEKAAECLSVGISETRIPVHVTGDDLTHVVKKKNGAEKIVHQIRVDSLEKIKERRADRPDVLPEKIRLYESS
ncbi:hypothetical protein [Dictyobacter formicarum]|uniref:Uncharacterized protein n=1 Tax=Dictyobacter formicarum TaxID=2778368 RepID=A0ABQ3VGB5_9CHLR|nr:hypothetical protein [Dictyobacter formicarum]GHO85202.1 hypothetical protein KSZ_32080 [Dictyobacter formicarum]